MTGRSSESVSVPEEIHARLTRPTIRLSGSVGHPMVASFFEWAELRFGFAEKPDVPTALRGHVEEIGYDPTTASFFVGRGVPVASLRPEVPVWQERIYAFMVRNAVSAPDYFLIAPRQVVRTRDQGRDLNVLQRSAAT